MTSKEQTLSRLHDRFRVPMSERLKAYYQKLFDEGRFGFDVSRIRAPERPSDDLMRSLIDCLGGMAGSWRTDYSECTYYHPQRINGVLIDLSTIQKVRAYYDNLPRSIT